jgi:adenosine deaminase
MSVALGRVGLIDSTLNSDEPLFFGEEYLVLLYYINKPLTNRTPYKLASLVTSSSGFYFSKKKG